MLCAVQARTLSIAAIVPHAATTNQPVKSPDLVSRIVVIYLEQDKYRDSCPFLETFWPFLWVHILLFRFFGKFAIVILLGLLLLRMGDTSFINSIQYWFNIALFFRYQYLYNIRSENNKRQSFLFTNNSNTVIANNTLAYKCVKYLK